MTHNAENDAETYCGAEYGEVREGECECPRCVGPFPDPLQDWPMPGYLKSDDAPNLDHSADYDAADVTPEERETTLRMVSHLLSMLADEPPQDAGGHPSPEVHQQVGAAWADWDRQRRAWCALLAPRLLREAMDDVRGGPHARALPPGGQS